MSQASDDVFEAAMHMAAEDRIALIGRLLETLPEQEIGLSIDSPDLREELDRRFAERDGEVPWAELRAEG
jgi:hypothetical protein